MSPVDTEFRNGPCRGIIVAKDISDNLILAVQRVQGAPLYRYKVAFSVEQVF